VNEETQLTDEQRTKALLSILEDVVQDNEVLEKEQQNFQALIESLHDGVVVFGTNLKITLVNQVFLQMCGMQREEITITTVADVFSQKRFAERLHEVVVEGKRVVGEEWEDKGQIYQASIAPIKAAGVQIVGAALVLHDITHLKEVDRMKTEFVSLASHQLRTPLTAIKLYLEMLVKGYGGELSEKQSEYLNKVELSTERMIRLVGDLLNVSRLEGGQLIIEPRVIDVPHYVQQIVDDVGAALLKSACKVQLDVKKLTQTKMPVDELLFSQIIRNLLANAFTYKSPDRACKVRLSLRERKSSRRVAKPDLFELVVEDNGIGIPEKAQAHVFEKLFRADNAKKISADGTGLGLYVCKMILDAAGGSIRFDSEVGKGTKFYVTLPLKGMSAKKGTKYLSTHS
jgi:PAS domain S-box-containing protein